MNQETINQRERDQFCFTCYLSLPTLFCSTCSLSFHNTRKCSETRKKPAQKTEQWQCEECKKIEKDKEFLQNKEIDAQCLKRLLKGALHSLKLNVFNSVAKFSKEIADIDDKVNADTYSCLQELLLDIKRIAYNVNVHRSHNVEAAERLVKQAYEILYRIRLCHKCFPSNSITEVCNPPHLLVWAQLRSTPYWPAKLMKVDSETEKVDVIFFDAQHNRGLLMPKDCQIYSQKNPSIRLGVYEDLLRRAESEASSYIDNIKAKFGEFNYATDPTPLNIEHLDRHLNEMIPNALPPDTNSTPPIPTQTKQQRKRRASVYRSNVDVSPEFDMMHEAIEGTKKKFSQLNNKNRKLTAENVILTGKVTAFGENRKRNK